jgi:hypothetical protein
MKKLNLILSTAFSILLLSESSGQDFEDCKAPDFMFIRAEQSAQFDGSLQDYIEGELKGKYKKLNGSVHLQILIDSSGKVCCMSVQNNSTKIPGTSVRNLINNMPPWVPARQNEHPINFSALIQLIFQKNKITVKYMNEKK